MLMVATKEDAAKSEISKRRATEARVTGMTETFAQNVAQMRQKYPGLSDKAAPTVEKALGEKIYIKSKKE